MVDVVVVAVVVVVGVVVTTGRGFVPTRTTVGHAKASERPLRIERWSRPKLARANSKRLGKGSE